MLRRGGFSFVEIAIAILILALGILPMIGVFISNSEETRANKNRSFAAVLASSALERYRKFRPEKLKSMFGTEIKPEEYENTRKLPESSPELATDPILTPKNLAANDPAKRFYEVIEKLNFRRVLHFKQISNRVGQLQCTVVWSEKAAGREKVLTYSLATLLTDPIFPTGRDDNP
jgi:type II secretory pathway pseudopilin PulG